MEAIIYANLSQSKILRIIDLMFNFITFKVAMMLIFSLEFTGNKIHIDENEIY